MKHRLWIAFALGLGLAVLAFRPPSQRGGITTTMSGHMPAWTLRSMDGSLMASTNLSGRIVVLNFWATHCPPCLQEIPELNAFAATHGTNEAVLIGISLDENPDQVLPGFLTRNRLHYPVLKGESTMLDAVGGVFAIPTTVVVDSEGRFRFRHIGPVRRQDLERWMGAIGSSPARPAP